jgi:hypothetical protein
MEKTYTKTRVCELCGKTITYKVYIDDGFDWLGHQRGSSSCKEIGNECNCTKYKRMCLNCKYYNNINEVCNNQQVIADYNKKIEESFFNIEMKSFIGIKTPTRHCDYWELSQNIAKQVFNK